MEIAHAAHVQDALLTTEINLPTSFPGEGFGELGTSDAMNAHNHVCK